MQQVIQQYQGPIPPPESLKKFDEIEPGLASRIVTMAEKNGDHLRDIQKQQVAHDRQKTEQEVDIVKRGQLFAFILMVLFLILASVLIFTGKGIIGTIFGTVSIIAVILAFLNPLKKKKK